MSNNNQEQVIDLNFEVGKKLKELRENLRYSQVDVSKKLGLSRAVYGQIERGLHEINLTIIQNVIKLYNIDLHYLFNIEKTNVNVFSGNFEKLSNQGTNNTLNINIPKELIDELKKAFRD